ncbi:MAG TPA: HlyD family efflux transporter periplasmic adaptor subunit [Luteitalea sp.]|nr:HlyD family efflux transporter periplasmic adaptor subunit [Luteitalea sp.]
MKPLASRSWPHDGYIALQTVHVPRASQVLARLLLVMLGLTAALLVFTPWQQNVTGTGRVIAYNPEERPQEVQAPIDGRILRWHVVEGTRVRKGTPLVDLTDNDPSFMQRLADERAALERSVAENARRLRAIEDRVAGLGRTRTTGVDAADARVRMANERVAAAERALSAARAAEHTARLNLTRQEALSAKGLASARALELAQLDIAQKTADVDRSSAALNAARHEQQSLGQERERTDADAATRIDEAWAAHASAASDLAKARADLTRLDVRVARQATQHVLAPIDGTVWRVVGRQNGEFLKAGATLVVLVPDVQRTVVELFMNGNDIPIVSAGRSVRLQFEGWPALQFSGWPSAAVGTFGGRVLLVDATDDGQGRFRVLVEPDPRDEPWPSGQYLRQGVRANGWVLLDNVALGYELWRQFNGFPPAIAMKGAADNRKATSNVVEVGK